MQTGITGKHSSGTGIWYSVRMDTGKAAGWLEVQQPPSLVLTATQANQARGEVCVGKQGRVSCWTWKDKAVCSTGIII